MALLKHRGITRASYDALIAPDPNTEYTVLETDGTFTRYIGSKAIKDKTAARFDDDGNFDLKGKSLLNYKNDGNEDPINRLILKDIIDPILIYESPIETLQFEDGIIIIEDLDYSLLRDKTKNFIMVQFRTDEGQVIVNSALFERVDDYGYLQIIYDTLSEVDNYRSFKCQIYNNTMEIYTNAEYPVYLLYVTIIAF